MSADDAVLYQETAGIARITLNRPDALNALSLALLQRLATLLDQILDRMRRLKPSSSPAAAVKPFALGPTSPICGRLRRLACGSSPSRG